MQIVYMLLYLFAGVCFGLAAAGRSFEYRAATRKIDLLSLGLLLWVLVEFIQAVVKL